MNALKIGLSALGIGAAGYALYQSTNSWYDRTISSRSYEDINVQKGIISPQISGFIRSNFLEANLNNMAIGFGAEYIGNKLIKGGNAWNLPLIGKGPRISGAVERFNRIDTPRHIKSLLGHYPSKRPKDYTLVDLERIAGTNRLGSRSAQRALSAAGASSKTLAKLKWGSRLRTIGKAALWMPFASMAFDAVSSLASLPVPERRMIPQRTTALSGTFMDTSTAFTQRQRALEAIHNSQFSGRSGLGNEANFFHH